MTSIRVDQYCYLLLRSTSVTADAMTRRIGLAPDESWVLGSRRPVRPIPDHHGWKMLAQDRSVSLDEQLDALLDRLDAYQERISALTTDGSCEAALVVFRSFEVREWRADAPRATRLGLWLDRRLMRFLATVDAEVEIDEYGDE